MRKNYFEGCKSYEDAKANYYRLMKKFHPDVNPEGEEITKIIINQYKQFTIDSYNTQAGEFFRSKEWDPRDLTPFEEILRDIIHYEKMRIEIIGFWIYCFDSYEYREFLMEKGFWFSKKHKAWVFSGSKKRNIRSRKTTQDIREAWGSMTVETSKKEKIAG